MTIDPSESIDKKELVNPKTIKKGVFYFSVITVIAMVSVFIYTNTGKTLDVWKSIQPKYICICLAIAMLDMLLGGWRNHVFVRELSPGTSQWVSFKANAANTFMGSMTPSQSGGGLAQLYVFYKNGIKLSDGITISFLNWVATLLYFPISGLIAYKIINKNIPDGVINYLAKFGFTVFTTIFILIMIALFSPKTIGVVIQKIALLVGKVNARWQEKLTRFGEKAKTSMVDYRNKCTTLLARKPHLMLFTFLITIVLYLNKYLLAYFAILAMGAEADFWVIMAIQAIIYLLLYFAPSPGGSGIAEVSIATLMTGIINDEYLGSLALMQRSFIIFIPAIIGAFILLKAMNQKKD